MKNKVIIAAAGAGKTQHIVKSAYNCVGRVLITTYTIENTEEIKNRFYKLYGSVPSNVIILTWFSFLLRYLVKPFQNDFIPQKIMGVNMENGNTTRYIKKNTVPYYLDRTNHIYSGKIGSLALKLIEDFNYFPIVNLTRIFQHIYIDEMQDLSGNDLDIAGILLKTPCHVEGVCDPRQSTFQTSGISKNKNCKGQNIVQFLEKQKILIDTSSLNTNHRCCKDMVTLSNELYPEYPAVECGTFYENNHIGIFVVRPNDLHEYKNIEGIQELSYNKTFTKAFPEFNGMNIGASKGRTYERTVLYLPKTHIDWLLNKGATPTGESKAILYVALTRAKLSTAIVFNYKDNFSHPMIKKFK